MAPWGFCTAGLVFASSMRMSGVQPPSKETNTPSDTLSETGEKSKDRICCGLPLEPIRCHPHHTPSNLLAKRMFSVHRVEQIKGDKPKLQRLLFEPVPEARAHDGRQRQGELLIL